MKLYGVSYSAVFYFLAIHKKSKSQGVKKYELRKYENLL